MKSRRWWAAVCLAVRPAAHPARATGSRAGAPAPCRRSAGVPGAGPGLAHQVPYGLGNHARAAPRRHAGDDGVVRRQLQHVGRCAAGALHPCFADVAVGTAACEGGQRVQLQIGGALHRWVVRGQGQQQRFLKHRGAFHRRIGFQPRWWPGDQGGIERVGGDLLHQLSGGSGGQVQHHVGPLGMQVAPAAGAGAQRPCFPWRPGAGAHPAAAGARPGGPLRPGPAGGRRSRAGIRRPV